MQNPPSRAALPSHSPSRREPGRWYWTGPAVILALVLGCLGGGHGGRIRPGAPATPPQPPQGSTGALSVRVTARDTGQVLVGAEVLVQGAGYRIRGNGSTGVDGTCTLAGLPLGEPLLLVTQPRIGAVTYEARASEPITLAKGTPAPAVVDLACATVPLPGRVEGTRRDLPFPMARPALVKLVQKTPVGGTALVRETVIRHFHPEADGSFHLEGVPPGSYEVRFLCPGLGPHQRPSRYRRMPRHPRSDQVGQVEITVKAGETVFVPWPPSVPAAHGPEETAEMEEAR
jgi:hypothetical protein